MKHITCVLATAATLLTLGASTHAGNVFVSGHDPDFHAALGPNPTGAQHLIQQSLSFARNGSTLPFLFIQTDTSNTALGDHTDSETGLTASGFTAGVDYVKVSATTFASTPLLTTSFSAIFVPSDHGGTLTGNDLKALNGRSSDILSFINAGGGLVAFAEDGFHQPASPGPEPALFGFLPFLVTASPQSEAENGNTLTPFGLSLGLANSDVNGNFSHNVFTATGGMTVVDVDAGQEILSLAFSGRLTGHGVPEPSTLAVLGGSLAGLIAMRVRHRRNR
jgi:hypothetical protein